MDEDQPTRSKASLAVGLAVSIAICGLAGAIGGIATADSVTGDWFVELAKPAWNPPNWIFGPVWSILYLMMGIAAWWVWKQAGLAKAKFTLAWFGFHLMLNTAWSILFFGMEQPGWAAIEIVVLWLSIAISMRLFFRHSKLAAGLLIPYLMWVSFATCLNFAIWSLN